MAGKPKARSNAAEVPPFNPADYCPNGVDVEAWIRDPMAVHYESVWQYEYELSRELGMHMSKLPPLTWARECVCTLCVKARERTRGVR